MTDNEVAAQIRQVADQLEARVDLLRALADELDSQAGGAPPFEDISETLPVNHQPDHPYLVARGWVWWPERDLSEIAGITIHHTLSHSPLATATYCTRPQAQGGKGYPSIQYHFWVSQGDGCPVYLCAPLEWQIWHDHTGPYPKTISIGLAGRLHLAKPPHEQVEAAARLIRWLMDQYGIPLDEVRGHCERYAGTICPGWNQTGWRDDLFALITP